MHDKIVAWLQSQHTTLFGRFFDTVQNADSAADWFEAQMQSFLDYVDETYPAPNTAPSLPALLADLVMPDDFRGPIPYMGKHYVAPTLPRAGFDVT